MRKTLIYPAKAVFPSQEALLSYMENKNMVKGKYLIAGSNMPEHNFLAFYNPKTNEVELEVKGNSVDELVDSGIVFFQLTDNLLGKVY